MYRCDNLVLGNQEARAQTSCRYGLYQLSGAHECNQNYSHLRLLQVKSSYFLFLSSKLIKLATFVCKLFSDECIQVLKSFIHNLIISPCIGLQGIA